MMHALYRAYEKRSREQNEKELEMFYTNQAEMWKTRVFMFAKTLCDEVVHEKQFFHELGEELQVKTAEDGLPEYPYSLMEGLAGEIYFLCDILSPDLEVRFPGFEI